MSTPKDPFDPSGRKLFDSGFYIMAMICVISGVAVWILRGKEVFFGVIFNDFIFAMSILPKIAGGILFATSLGLILPREKILAAVGPESGVRGLVIAAAAGAVVPGGPAVMFPLAAGMLASGVDIGAAIALISGWVLLGINRILIWELSFVPVDIVGLRLLLTLPLPVLIGLFARYLFKVNYSTR